jgi:putative N6-adenine-specific DNA methylase
VVARVAHDRVTVSIDASGALLHRRGYRQALAKAPLRETMAAALLLASGWDATAPLLDPMCGSGTIPIEGALMARRIAPGIHRAFAFMGWPTFEPDAWERLTSEARAHELASSPVEIRGSDRDEGAVAAAVSNAERAGVASDVRFERRALSALVAPAGTGWIVGNPPYGKRVSEDRDVRDFFAALGRVARERLHGWTLALLSPDRALDRQLGLRVEELARTSNGGIPVRIVVGEVG